MSWGVRAPCRAAGRSWQQGDAARGGQQRLPAGQGWCFHLTGIWAQACKDRPGGRVRTDPSSFALPTVVFIFRASRRQLKTSFLGCAQWGLPQSPPAEQTAQLESGRRQGPMRVTVVGFSGGALCACGSRASGLDLLGGQANAGRSSLRLLNPSLNLPNLPPRPD